MDHAYNAADFNKKIIRTIRDPRDAAISNYKRNTIEAGHPDFYTCNEYANTPLPRSQGGLFGLGHIDELAIQEAWLKKIIPANLIHYVPLENMRESGETELRHLTEFIGVKRREENIASAIRATRSENFSTRYGAPLENHFRWKKREYPDFEKIHTQAVSVIGNSHSEL